MRALHKILSYTSMFSSLITLFSLNESVESQYFPISKSWHADNRNALGVTRGNFLGRTIGSPNLLNKEIVAVIY